MDFVKNFATYNVRAWFADGVTSMHVNKGDLRKRGVRTGKVLSSCLVASLTASLIVATADANVEKMGKWIFVRALPSEQAISGNSDSRKEVSTSKAFLDATNGLLASINSRKSIGLSTETLSLLSQANAQDNSTDIDIHTWSRRLTKTIS